MKTRVAGLNVNNLCHEKEELLETEESNHLYIHANKAPSKHNRREAQLGEAVLPCCTCLES